MKLTDAEFGRIKDFMYRKCGIVLADKKVLVEGRLSTVLRQKGYDNFTQFIDHMEQDKTGADLSFAITKLTTNFTYFYREEHHFEFLKEVVFPQMIPKAANGNLGIWSAGCSSGEEPYTIAMSVADYLGGNKKGIDARILATDISEKVLNIAYKGVYTDDRLTKIPDEWQKKYFTTSDNKNFAVKPVIKNEVIFRKFNLMEPQFKFKQKFNIIFCRNVMIYFDNETRRKLFKKFYDALLPGGYFFIGLSETMSKEDRLFKYVQPSIYQKI